MHSLRVFAHAWDLSLILLVVKNQRAFLRADRQHLVRQRPFNESRSVLRRRQLDLEKRFSRVRPHRYRIRPLRANLNLNPASAGGWLT